MSDPISDVTDLATVPPAEREKLRTGLLDQIEYLTEEVEALRTVVGAVPEAVQSGRPTDDDLSMKELYAMIAVLDRTQRTEWVEQLRDADETPVALEPTDAETAVREGDWNDQDLGDVLDAVQDARRDLHDLLAGLDADVWMREAVLGEDTRTLFELVHGFADADFHRLRDLGYRLHDADLSERE
jgi:hypothetical protein